MKCLLLVCGALTTYIVQASENSSQESRETSVIAGAYSGSTLPVNLDSQDLGDSQRSETSDASPPPLTRHMALASLHAASETAGGVKTVPPLRGLETLCKTSQNLGVSNDDWAGRRLSTATVGESSSGQPTPAGSLPGQEGAPAAAGEEEFVLPPRKASESRNTERYS